MIELRNYMYECFCNKYKVRHFYNPFTCEIVYYPSNEINNNFYSKRCKYFSDYNFCKNSCCHYKHLKDIELPVENDIANTLIERHTTESGEIGWKITKPSYDPMTSKQDSYDSMKPSYDPMTSKQDSYDSMKPSYDAMISKQDSYDAMASKQDSYDAMKPSYDAMKPSYDAMKPTYDAMISKQDSYDAMKPTYDAMTSKQDLYNPKESTESLYLSYDLQKQQEIPTYPSYDPTYPSYDPTNKKPKLLPETTKVCCHYHNKYRPKKEMIKIENKLWSCSKDNQCKIATIM